MQGKGPNYQNIFLSLATSVAKSLETAVVQKLEALSPNTAQEDPTIGMTAKDIEELYNQAQKNLAAANGNFEKIHGAEAPVESRSKELRTAPFN